MSIWENTTLGNVLTLQRGFDITKKEQIAGSVPIVSSSGIKSYHNKVKVKAPGVVIGRKGTLGTVHYVKQDYWPHDTTLWVKDFKGNSPEFIYHFLKVMHLEAYDTGSSNPTLNRNHAHKIPLRFPSIPIQKKIAAVLSAYDDLIENNNRRIALLEKMAEEIYREWFVRLRFPGHEGVVFRKGIPEGWESRKLGETVSIVMGQSPKSEFYNDLGNGLPFHQGVGTYGPRFPEKKVYCTVKKRLANKGDILFSVRAPVGRLNIADSPMIIGRGVAALRHNEGRNSYLFYLLKHYFSNEDVIGNGSIFNSVGKDELTSFQILEPDVFLIEQYDSIAKKIDFQIEALYKALVLLRKTRDRLLTRLISGKLSIEDLDIQFPPSMTDES